MPTEVSVYLPKVLMKLFEITIPFPHCDLVRGSQTSKELSTVLTEHDTTFCYTLQNFPNIVI